MKKAGIVLAVLAAMAASFFLMTKLFLYYANRPLGGAAVFKTEKVKETKEVLQFIHKSHESFNSFLNYGKAEKYTEGDWKQLRKWFGEQEQGLKTIDQKAVNAKIKKDLKRSYEITKLGIDTGNIQYVILGHRVYHDLDILTNGYSEETNIWGCTEFGNGQHVKELEEEIKKNKKG
ncbi:hypothetical protein [Bacillus panaciterrae]|uniref:hypothetical protein n=1 Tax=Ectobacillus panaciterrae TaxID=363872 RepID=UPI00042A7375